MAETGSTADEQLVVPPPSRNFIYRLVIKSTGQFAGWYPGVAPHTIDDWVTLIVQKKPPPDLRIGSFAFAPGLGIGIRIKGFVSEGFPSPEPTEIVVVPIATRVVAYLPPNLTSANFFKLIPKEASASRTDGDLTIQTIISGKTLRPGR